MICAPLKGGRAGAGSPQPQASRDLRQGEEQRQAFPLPRDGGRQAFPKYLTGYRVLLASKSNCNARLRDQEPSPLPRRAVRVLVSSALGQS